MNSVRARKMSEMVSTVSLSPTVLQYDLGASDWDQALTFALH